MAAAQPGRPDVTPKDVLCDLAGILLVFLRLHQQVDDLGEPVEVVHLPVVNRDEFDIVLPLKKTVAEAGQNGQWTEAASCLGAEACTTEEST